jgi:predicted acyl esterase
LVDRNPQTFVENIFLAREEDFVKATQRIYRTPEYPSRVEVLVLPGGGNFRPV